MNHLAKYGADQPVCFGVIERTYRQMNERTDGWTSLEVYYSITVLTVTVGYIVSITVVEFC